MGRKAIDLTGQRFGKLTVIKRVENIPRHHARWLCKCDCVNMHIVESHGLRSGDIKSCGCLLVELHQTHGESKSRLYNVWRAVKQRCSNPNCKEYKWYGARGISVCDEWKNFENFYKWAIEQGYDSEAKRGEFTIERIDHEGNYEPSNSKWITIKEKSSKKRNTVFFEENGLKLTFRELSEMLDIPVGTLYWRWEEKKPVLKEDEKERLFKMAI